MYYDTNADGSINLGDNIENDHLEILVEYCDTDNNQSLNACEIHDCVVKCENEWRAQYCPADYADLYCENVYDCITCEGAWNCEDIYNITLEVFAMADTNEDGQINLGDNVE